jgi:hypothetical protein
MSASKPRKEVKMSKARLISLTASLCMLVFYFAGYMRGLSFFLGHGGSWFDGH